VSSLPKQLPEKQNVGTSLGAMIVLLEDLYNAMTDFRQECSPCATGLENHVLVDWTDRDTYAMRIINALSKLSFIDQL
jgi:hypothetical protein